MLLSAFVSLSYFLMNSSGVIYPSRSLPRPLGVQASDSLCSRLLISVSTLRRRRCRMAEGAPHWAERWEQLEEEKAEKSVDWKLSGLMPAEVVPPSTAIMSRKTGQGLSHPLSPGWCYPILERMNRGPLAPYESSVDRMCIGGRQWRKQASCQHPLQHSKKPNVFLYFPFTDTQTIQSYHVQWHIPQWHITVFVSLLYVLYILIAIIYIIYH